MASLLVKKERRKMDAKKFDAVIQKQIQRSLSVLTTKANEYAPKDRLHNFKTAGILQGKSPRQALSGMMAKHTISIFDMLQNNEYYDIAVWDEKITDHINYLLILRTIIEDEIG
jgi:hypothetical protein